jgi:hypothetical protein
MEAACGFVNHDMITTAAWLGSAWLLRGMLLIAEEGLLEQLFDPDADVSVNIVGRLVWALRCGHEALAVAIIRHPRCTPRLLRVAFVDDEIREYTSPLHEATHSGLNATVAALIEQGAEPWLPTPNGQTPLVCALKTGQERAARALLAYAPVRNQALRRDDDDDPSAPTYRAGVVPQETLAALTDARLTRCVVEAVGVARYRRRWYVEPSCVGEGLRLHHLAALTLRLPALQYLVEEAGFPLAEKTRGGARGRLGLSLLHCAAFSDGPAADAGAEERQLAVVRWLVETKGMSPLEADEDGLRPAAYAFGAPAVEAYLLAAEAEQKAAGGETGTGTETGPAAGPAAWRGYMGGPQLGEWVLTSTSAAALRREWVQLSWSELGPRLAHLREGLAGMHAAQQVRRRLRPRLLGLGIRWAAQSVGCLLFCFGVATLACCLLLHVFGLVLGQAHWLLGCVIQRACPRRVDPGCVLAVIYGSALLAALFYLLKALWRGLRFLLRAAWWACWG